MNFNISDDDDEFAPNPFRSSNSNDFLGTPNPAPMQQQQLHQPPPLNNSPDPYSGMTGSFNNMTPTTPGHGVTQQPSGGQSPDPSTWSGTLDQRAAAVESYGGTGTTARNGQPSTPFSFFSLSSWMSCCSLDSYQQYFNVDTVDIQERLKASLLKFYQPDQFRSVVGDLPTETLKGPDLYGPFWVAMTLVFILAATSNIYDYWEYLKKHDKDDDKFEVDIHHLRNACNVVLVFVFGMSSAFWLAASCMGMSGISWGLWVCVYGYSQVPFVVAAVLVCIFPMDVLTWLLIVLAGVASGLLVVRNLSTPLMAQDAVGNAKAAPLILGMLAVHFVYILVIKLTFFEYHDKKKN